MEKEQDHKGRPLTYWGGKSEQNKDHIPEIKGMVDERKYYFSKATNGVWILERKTNNGFVFIPYSEHQNESEATERAKTLTDALNTIQKCNLMSSQLFDKFYVESTKNDLQAEKIIELQKQNDELLEFIKKARYYNISDETESQELIKKYKL